MSLFEEIEQRVEAQHMTYADCEPLGWTTWPLALGADLGEIAQAVLHRKTWGKGSARAAAVGLAATAVRFLYWIDRQDNA